MHKNGPRTPLVKPCEDECGTNVGKTEGATCDRCPFASMNMGILRGLVPRRRLELLQP